MLGASAIRSVPYFFSFSRWWLRQVETARLNSLSKFRDRGFYRSIQLRNPNGAQDFLKAPETQTRVGFPPGFPLQAQTRGAPQTWQTHVSSVFFFFFMQEPKGGGNWHGSRVAYSWDRVASRSLRVATSKGSCRQSSAQPPPRSFVLSSRLRLKACVSQRKRVNLICLGPARAEFAHSA